MAGHRAGLPGRRAAQAAAPAPGNYSVVNNGSGLCLTVPGSSSSDGVQLTQTGCGGAELL